MSTKHYEDKFSEAENEFLDLYQLEFRPYDTVSNDRKKMMAIKKPQEWLQFYANLYVSYLDTFKKLEDVYDNTIHPQKRPIFKNMLDNCMMRLMEIRRDLIMYNVSTKALNSDFVNFDELLYELKVLPEKLEVPIPRYFKENNKENMVRDDLIYNLLKVEDRHLPEEEELVIRNPVEMEPGTEIWMILVNERGRQGIARGQATRAGLQAQLRKKKKLDAEKNKDEEGSLIVQKYLRAFIDRREVERLRNEEMEFLGMLPSKTKLDDLKFLSEEKKEGFNLDKEVEKVREHRKGEQARNKNLLKSTVEKVKEEIRHHEIPDMKENLLYQMRNWITEYYEKHEGKELPDKIEDFYKRNDKAIPLTKEEEDAKRKADQEKEKAKKKAADDKKKKKKTEAEEFLDSRAARGPDNSKALRCLNEDMQKYVDEWMNKEKIEHKDNFDQLPNKEIIIKEVMPEIEEEIKSKVNDMIKAELLNLHIRLNIAKKRGKGPKPKKPKKPRKPKIPLEGLIRGRDPRDLMADLTKAGIVKLLPPTQMKDFLGDQNLLRTLEESKSEGQPDPSLAQLREVCTQFIALPMGSGFTCGCEPKDPPPPPPPEDIPVKEFKCNKANRTYMFYGPQGTGKSMMVRALATECRAMVLDISGYNVADRFPDKKRFQQMLVTVFRVAKEFQPAIILMDEVEQYFPKKLKPANKKKGQPAPVIGKCQKYKKDLTAQVTKHLEHFDKVALIGLTNKPNYCNLTEVKKFFYKKFYFPYPNQAARCLIFKSLAEKSGIQLSDAFKMSMFAHITDGVTPGSMSRALDAVLTKRRKTDIALRPLTVQDLVVPLSENYTCSAEEYEMFTTFTHSITGIKDRQEELENATDKKGKGGKKPPGKK